MELSTRRGRLVSRKFGGGKRKNLTSQPKVRAILFWLLRSFDPLTMSYGGRPQGIFEAALCGCITGIAPSPSGRSQQKCHGCRKLLVFGYFELCSFLLRQATGNTWNASNRFQPYDCLVQGTRSVPLFELSLTVRWWFRTSLRCYRVAHGTDDDPWHSTAPQGVEHWLARTIERSSF